MANIEFRLPSKVPYGYVNVSFTTDDTPEPETIAAMYAAYVMAFAEQERESLNNYGKPVQASSAPFEGPPGDPEAAAKRLAEDKKPRTVDEAEEMAAQLIKSELGGVVVSKYNNDGPGDVEADAMDAAKPWENEAPATKAKPWESGGSAPKAATINW